MSYTLQNNYQFFKFMHDIIDSCAWAKLSSAAKTLYPVLCRFSDDNFKYVWPGTEELLRLTGFKSKKSLQQAKKELFQTGLIDFIPGTGRTSTRYYFRFDYDKSTINLNDYRARTANRRGAVMATPEEAGYPPEKGTDTPPKKIQININNNYNNQQVDVLNNIHNLLLEFINYGKTFNFNNDYKNTIIQNILSKYDDLDIGEAVKIAIKKGKNGDIQYLEGILKNKKNQKYSDKKESVFVKSDSPIDNRIPSNLRKYFSNLKYHYSYDDIHYYVAKSNVPKNYIENYLKTSGINIKIIMSNFDEHLNSLKFNIANDKTENKKYR
ncbi:MAG: helix-turn-helix domain-containing protein [Spirochaetia bacterium]|nr:helix-turn-helix domain-containing protein [Spirochaetia bacterium]